MQQQPEMIGAERGGAGRKTIECEAWEKSGRMDWRDVDLMTPALELSKRIRKNGMRPSFGELNGMFVARGHCSFSKFERERNRRCCLKEKWNVKKVSL